MTRILVPTDFSTRSLEALGRALTYTQTLGGELLLLHVVEGPPLHWYAVNGQPEDVYPSCRTDPEGSSASRRCHRRLSTVTCARRRSGSLPLYCRHVRTASARS